MKHQKGFTLLEVLVAAVIVIVLTAVGVSSYVSVSQKSRDARRSSDLEQVRSALEMYRSDLGYYPATGNGAWITLSTLGTGGTNVMIPTYMPSIPTEPKDNTNYPYQYMAMNKTGAFYYGYCITSKFESASVNVNTCSTALPVVAGVNYNYGLKNP